MEEKICKKRSYQVVEALDEFNFVVERKKKRFLFVDYQNRSDEFQLFVLAYKKLKTTGIRIPKVYRIDIKNQNVVMECVIGPTALDVLIEHDLDDSYYEQIFILAWSAKVEELMLDFDPKNFIMHDGLLYYVGFKFSVYDPKNPFQLNAIYYWFYTKQFVEYLKEHNLPYDQSRLKDEYSINREIALKIVKYYR